MTRKTFGSKKWDTKKWKKNSAPSSNVDVHIADRQNVDKITENVYFLSPIVTDSAGIRR
jgi:hypothetical protein